MATWNGVSSKLRGAMVMGAILVAIAAGASVTPFLTSCEDTAEAGEGLEARREQARVRRTKEVVEFRQQWKQHEQEREDRWAQEEEELHQRLASLDEEIVEEPSQKHVRRVRRFLWESPAETRGKIWNVPEQESREATLTAFLRVCISEADGNAQDCVGVWQVVKNIRRRSCERGQIRRITECVEGEGETLLSTFRRSQRHVLGMIKARNSRATWISKLTPDCEPPEEYPNSLNQWDAQYGSKVCPQAVALGRSLIKGDLPASAPGQHVRWLPGRPITWGGRCESAGGACDDRMACSRGLARIPNTDTLNAFWCRIGSAGCRDTPEPICLAMGYRYEGVPTRRPLPPPDGATGRPEEPTRAPEVEDALTRPVRHYRRSLRRKLLTYCPEEASIGGLDSGEPNF